MTRRRKLVIGAVVALIVIASATIGVVALTGSSGSSQAAQTTTTEPSTSTLAPTTTLAPPVAPLTGLPDPGGDAQKRPALSVKVENSTYPKCDRCWNLRADVGRDASHPTLCGRCIAVLNAP